MQKKPSGRLNKTKECIFLNSGPSSERCNLKLHYAQYETMYCFRLYLYPELTHNATPLLFQHMTVQCSDVPDFVWSYSRIITILVHTHGRMQFVIISVTVCSWLYRHTCKYFKNLWYQKTYINTKSASKLMLEYSVFSVMYE